MRPTVTIHCKPYVKHWLESQYGKRAGSAVHLELPPKSNLLKVFHSCLDKKFFPSEEYDLKEYPATVEFKVSQRHLTVFGSSVQIQLQHLLNDIFERELKIYMHTYVKAHCQRLMTVDKAILLFRTNFGFTETVWKDDAIRTAYFRREKEIKNIFSGTDTKKKQYVTATYW